MTSRADEHPKCEYYDGLCNVHGRRAVISFLLRLIDDQERVEVEYPHLTKMPAKERKST